MRPKLLQDVTRFVTHLYRPIPRNLPHLTVLKRAIASRTATSSQSIAPLRITLLAYRGIHRTLFTSELSDKPAYDTTHKDDTIYAVSTAPGRAAIAIIRISGPACLEVYKCLCPSALTLKPRYASIRALYSSGTEVLDSNALVLYFPSPKSATGEDVLELHIHGGPATIKAVLAAISESKSTSGSRIRYAEPGEYTRRAFYNNRLDLTQIEALGDSLAAETEQQRRLAVQGTTSSLTQRYESWRQMLLAARGEVEALIDFSEDQHFDESPATLISNVRKQVLELSSQIELAIANSSRGELLRNGIKVALLGAPNVGKSSLLNQIVGREAAIVSNEPGTTRDVLETNIDIGGFFCNFGDLAGLRATGLSRKEHNHLDLEDEPPSTSSTKSKHQVSSIEAEGIRRAKQRVLSADVVILVLAISEDAKDKNPKQREPVPLLIEEEVLETLKQCDVKRQRVLCVINKVDLAKNVDWLRPRFKREKEIFFGLTYLFQLVTEYYPISCTGNDKNINAQDRQRLMDEFLNGLKHTFQEMTSALGLEPSNQAAGSHLWQSSLGATERQRLLLSDCQQHLANFLALGRQDGSEDRAIDAGETEEVDIVLAAEYLRAAADCLGRIMGKGESGDVEEVLGVVFEK